MGVQNPWGNTKKPGGIVPLGNRSTEKPACNAALAGVMLQATDCRVRIARGMLRLVFSMSQ